MVQEVHKNLRMQVKCNVEATVSITAQSTSTRCHLVSFGFVALCVLFFIYIHFGGDLETFEEEMKIDSILAGLGKHVCI